MSDTLKELAAAKAKVAELEASAAAEMRGELQALPELGRQESQAVKR